MNPENSTDRSGALDRVAVLLSGVCLLHCLALPAAVAILPFLGQIGERHLHAEMLVVVMPVSLVALALGYRRHARVDILAWGVAGLAVLVTGATVAHEAYGLMADRALTVTGSVVLAIAHYRNFRWSRHCRLSAS